MKKIVPVMLILAALSPPVFADKITVDTDDLPKELAQKVARVAAESKRNSWEGIGKEVGTAVNEALGAVVTNADKFGKSEVGRFTMFLVVWKIFGKDALRFIAGFTLVLIAFGMILYSYRNTMIPRRVLVSRNKATKEEKWQIVNEDPRDIGASRFLHAFVLVVVFGIGSIVMFA